MCATMLRLETSGERFPTNNKSVLDEDQIQEKRLSKTVPPNIGKSTLSRLVDPLRWWHRWRLSLWLLKSHFAVSVQNDGWLHGLSIGRHLVGAISSIAPAISAGVSSTHEYFEVFIYPS